MKRETSKKKPAPALAPTPDPALALASDAGSDLALAREAEGVKGLGKGYLDPAVQRWHLSASLSVTGEDI